MRPFSTMLANGAEAQLRETAPDDLAQIECGFARLSDRSRQLRFGSAINRLSDTQLREAVRTGDCDHFAVGVTLGSGSRTKPAALARFIRLDCTNDQAEIAITVVDAYQGLGLGTVLLGTLAKAASGYDIRALVAFVDARNRGMRHMLRGLSAAVPRGPDVPFVIPVHTDPARYPKTATGDGMRAAYRLARFGPQRCAPG